MSDKLSVTVFENGPLKIHNATSMNFCGEPVPCDGDVYLCRCGASSNMPFCDGSHAKVGFDGSNQLAAAKEVRVWEGNSIRTYFNPNTCMHVFYCKPLAALRERELAGDASAAEEIMRVVDACPSGALTYERKAELPDPEPFDAPAHLDIQEGGEIRVRGIFEINAALGDRQDVERATLCRCGMSKNKPWCDGRHKAKKDFR
jgi:CDGSH-type Zn-finger protein